MNRLPIYDIELDDEQIGLTAVSFVDEPAIMQDFLAFAEHKTLWMSSHEKHEVVSPILIPNQLIYRQTEEGEPYYIRWSEKTIAQAAEKFLLNGFWNATTVMHPMLYNKDLKYEDVLEKDVYLLRMWIVDDPKTDDINTKYGFNNLPKGTLCVHYKIHNRSLWKRIKSGELRGLSIEAFTNMVKSNKTVNLDINMNKFDVSNKQINLFQKFVNFVNEVVKEAESLADVVKTDDSESGKLTMRYFLDDTHFVDVDHEGFCRDEEGHLMKGGEWKLDNGNVMIIDDKSMFVETIKFEDLQTKGLQEQPIEPMIAESKLKKDDEEDKDEDEDPADGVADECEPDDNEPASEDVPMDDAEDSEDGTEETPKVPSATVEDEPEVEVPVDVEIPVEDVEPPYTLVPYEIDGKEYMLPQEVVDYINTLLGTNEDFKTQITMMNSQLPSVEPINTIGTISEGNSLFDAIRCLNYKK